MESAIFVIGWILLGYYILTKIKGNKKKDD